MVGSTLRAMNETLKNEAIKGPSPKRNRWVLGGIALGVAALVAGGVGLGNAAINYRADIQASEQAAADYYAAAAEQGELAQAAADKAQEYADAAGESTTALEASEAEAAAVIEAANARAAANVSNGLTPEGKCPAGTSAGEVREDGTEGLCAPTGPQGQTCAEYTDNVCTGWLKP